MNERLNSLAALYRLRRARVQEAQAALEEIASELRELLDQGYRTDRAGYRVSRKRTCPSLPLLLNAIEAAGLSEPPDTVFSLDVKAFFKWLDEQPLTSEQTEQILACFITRETKALDIREESRG